MDILITEAQIQERVRELGRQIEADYQGKPLTIVAVLTGSLILLADLIRQIQLPLRVALLQASSYKGATTTAGTLIINETFVPDVAGRDVLLLDDILDTGHTLATLVDRMSERGAAQRPDRRPAPQDRPPAGPPRARLLRLHHPRRLRRRLRPRLQRRLPPPALRRPCWASGSRASSTTIEVW